MRVFMRGRTASTPSPLMGCPLFPRPTFPSPTTKSVARGRSAARVPPPSRALSLLVASLLCVPGCRPADESAFIRLWIGAAPHSTDPIDLDATLNAIVLRPVYSVLVSKARKGVYQGMLARSWAASDGFKTWSFELRRDVFFSTGEPITPGHIVGAWGRLRRIMESRRSKSGLWEKLDGRPSSGGTSGVPGVEHDDDTITMRFSVPVPNLLEIISSPIYSIVHPSCYGELTSDWRCGNRPPASGPYEILSWSEDSVVLGLRRDFPADLRHPSAINTFAVQWSPGARRNADLIYGSSADREIPAGFRFWGGMESGISYLRCQSWTNPASILHGVEARRALRSEFRDELRRRGHRPARGFFPEVLTGPQEDPDLAKAVSRRRWSGTVRVRPPTAYLQFFLQSPAALEAAVRRLGLRFQEVETPRAVVIKEFAPGLSSYHSDIVFISTEVTLDNRDFSVRYMFSSKEGIRLPDPSGRIARLLETPPIDFKKLNDVLWDDAIVWPLRHNSFGMWSRDGFDFSQANLAIASTPLAWIGHAR